jgi:hypothetical protein
MIDRTIPVEFRKLWVLHNGLILGLYNTMPARPEVIEEVAKRGREFTLTSKPKGLRRPAANACFLNALVNSTPDLHYTEGFALVRLSERRSLWLHHAFLTNDEGQAIEVTLRTPAERYIGVVLSLEEAAEAVMREEGPRGAAYAGSAFTTEPLP